MDLNKLLEGYETRTRKATQYLEKLQQRATDMRKVLTERESVHEQTSALEKQARELRGERERLKGEHAEALFEGSVSEQQRITKRRAAIDKELGKLDEDIRSLRESVEALDPVEAATVRALLDSFSPPRYEDLLGEIQDQLEDANRQLVKAASDARSQLPASRYDDKDTYETVRGEHDTAYRSLQARERHLRKQDQERKARLARYGDASNTDQLHANIGSPGGSQASVTVVDDGSRVRPFG